MSKRKHKPKSKPRTNEETMVFNPADFGYTVRNVAYKGGHTYINGRAAEPVYRSIASGYQGIDEFKRDAQVPIANVGINILLENSYWIKEYDRLYVVDTNSITRKGRRISCTVVLAVIKSNEKEDSNGYDVDLTGMFFYKIGLDLNEPEKQGILDTIQKLMVPNNVRIGLITDHDVRNHEKYNLGTLPIYNDFYLPKNVKLIYASADRGASSNIFSKVIRICDRKSTDLIREHKAKIESIIGT